MEEKNQEQGEAQDPDARGWAERNPWLHVSVFVLGLTLLHNLAVVVFLMAGMSDGLTPPTSGDPASVDVFKRFVESLGAREFLMAVGAAQGAGLLFTLMVWQVGRGESRPALGLTEGEDVLRGLASGGALAAGLVVAAVGVATLLGVMTWQGFRPAEELGGGQEILLMAGLLLLGAFAEEVAYRGFVLRMLWRAKGPWPAVLGQGLLFTLVHAGNPGIGPLGALGVGLAGLALGLMVMRDGHLWRAVGFHFGWNALWALGLGLPLSGLTLPGWTTWELSPRSELWLGGEFGPEEGVLGLMGLAGLCGWLVATLKEVREPPPTPVIEEEPAEG